MAFVARGAGPLPGDLLLARFLQDLPLPGGGSGALLSNADSVVWLLLVVALAGTLLRRRWSDAAFIFLASLTAVLIGLALKLVVARRHPSAELVRVYDPSQSYSFPSITAFFSVVLLGAIVYLIWRTQLPRSALRVALGASSVLILALRSRMAARAGKAEAAPRAPQRTGVRDHFATPADLLASESA